MHYEFDDNLYKKFREEITLAEEGTGYCNDDGEQYIEKIAYIKGVARTSFFYDSGRVYIKGGNKEVDSWMKERGIRSYQF